MFIRVWKLPPGRCVLKILRESPKRTISASGGFWQLQMVSEPDTRRCANEGTGPKREVDIGQCANEDAGPRRGVDFCEPTSIGEGSECR